ncbi:MAG TPA: hypothetical protein VK158_06855 [Acidobacteriota bacterium]|nr:hypothetical protein [Acidobacteriota bacterium]
MQYRLHGDCSLVELLNHKGGCENFDLSLDGTIRVTSENLMYGVLLARTDKGQTHQINLTGDLYRNGFVADLTSVDQRWTDLRIEGLRGEDGAHQMYIQPFRFKQYTPVEGMSTWWIWETRVLNTLREGENTHTGTVFLTPKEGYLSRLAQRLQPIRQRFAEVRYHS